MPDSMDVNNVNPLTRPAPIAHPDRPQRSAPAGKDFKTVLLESLNQVNNLQQEATAGVERLATGETENMAEVFSAVRKAQVAFGLLMEIRNKLTDAYEEIQQMRV